MDDPARVPPTVTGREWSLTLAVADGVAHLVARGPMDVRGGREVDHALRRLTARAHRVTVDLRDVVAIDAATAAALARCVRRAADDGPVVTILAPPPAVATLLHDAGVPGVRPTLAAVPVGAAGPEEAAGGTAPAPRPGLAVGIDDRRRTIRLRLTGDLDAAAVPLLYLTADPYIQAGRTTVIDLHDLGSLAPAGLAALARLHHAAVLRNGRLRVVGGSPAVHRMFTDAGLEALFGWGVVGP